MAPTIGIAGVGEVGSRGGLRSSFSQWGFGTLQGFCKGLLDITRDQIATVSVAYTSAHMHMYAMRTYAQTQRCNRNLRLGHLRVYSDMIRVELCGPHLCKYEGGGGGASHEASIICPCLACMPACLPVCMPACMRACSHA